MIKYLVIGGVIVAEAMKTVEGWYCLHDFRTIDWTAWKKATEEERESALKEFKSLMAKWESVEENKAGSHAVYTVVGQKADLMFMVLRPTMKELNRVETELSKTALADFTKPAYSYVSVIEKSSYTNKLVNPEEDPAMLSKLHPTVPKTEYVCFYPMSKLRDGDHNWFMLPMEERKRMMFDHIGTAKPFTEQVKRMITGSTGLDDYEWGVTLFCDDALQFKKLIYETRFDEVSAVYGIFGSFYVGNILDRDRVSEFFGV
jgi:hydrogen peroxide-dependent heme synthase